MVEYTLKSLDLHAQSEHTRNSVRYDGEVHMTFQDTANAAKVIVAIMINQNTSTVL
jgi:carbonic anhydrase